MNDNLEPAGFLAVNLGFPICFVVQGGNDLFLVVCVMFPPSPGWASHCAVPKHRFSVKPAGAAPIFTSQPARCTGSKDTSPVPTVVFMQCLSLFSHPPATAGHRRRSIAWRIEKNTSPRILILLQGSSLLSFLNFVLITNQQKSA